MDGYFLTLCIVCMIVLLFYFMINITPHETDPIKLFIMIQEQDYDARAFTMRYDKTTKKYENYFLSSNTNYEKSYDAYPVDKTGKLINTVYDMHGELKYKDDGYKITGVNASFPCPDGYEGKTCQLKPICRDPEDDNTLLPLTNTQFNALGLFHNDTQLPTSTRRRKRKTPLYHNRIYVQCKTKGDYNLVACSPNKLLNFSTMKCGFYDVCEDHLNGYKHNYQISDSDPPLSKTEYYLCTNNKSKRTKCADNNVFSLVNNGCIQENICYNKGVTTFPIDSNNYIQCANDQGVRKHCPNGVVTLDDGSLSCKAQNSCKPQRLTKNTSMLTYDYAKIACTSDDEESLTTCNSTLGKRSWKYKWGADFTVDIDWPQKILNEDDKCVEATDAIITNPIMKIKWSPLMHESWDWDVVKERFICPKGNYVWDYKNDVLLNDSGRSYDENTIEYKTTDPSKPCNETVGNIAEEWWSPREFIGRPYRFCAVSAYSGPIDTYYWPTKTSAGYRADNCRFTYLGRSLTIYTYQSDKPPFGFKESQNNGPLELTSDEPIPKTNPGNYLWWSITSGKFTFFEFLEPTALETHVIPSPNTVDITKNQLFTILFKQYPIDKIEVINNELGCRRNGLYKYLTPGDPTSETTLLVNSGYIVCQIVDRQLIVDSIEPLTLTNNLTLK